MVFYCFFIPICRGLLCQLRPSVSQFGVYRLNATAEGCDVTTVHEPVDIYMREFTYIFIYSAT